MTVLIRPVTELDHCRGRSDAPAVLVEYGDFECPHSGAAFTIVQQLRATLGDAMCHVFRHFPLTYSHPHAEDAAEAAEAAGAQGRFWEMHDVLFTHQHALGQDDLIQYAILLQLDVMWFRRVLARQRFANRIREDMITGARSGVYGTPTFFINGQRYDGPHTYASMLAQIERALRRQAA
jgi:protein-disulfide isomerase